jgi:hypothetical protein
VSSAVWGFIGTLVGALAALGATYLQQSHASKREREASKRQAEERKHAFQRDTVLELQEVLAGLARLHAGLHHHSEMEWRKSGQWGRSQLPDDINEGVLTEAVRVVMLAERIDDDDLRQSLRTFTDALAGLSVMRDRNEAYSVFGGLINDYTTLQRQVGAVFRAL